MQLLFLLTSWSPEVKSIRRWWRRFLKCLLANLRSPKIMSFKASCVSSRCGRIRIEQICFSISPKVSLVYFCSHDLAKGTWGSDKNSKIPQVATLHNRFLDMFRWFFSNDQPFPGIPLGCLAVLGQGHGMGQRVQQIQGCAPLWFTTWRLQRCFRWLGGLVTDTTELPVAD